MFKPVKAKSAAEYFAMLVPERRAPMEALQKLIRTAAPSLTPNFIYNMPGYGKFPYRNAKKQQLEWPIIALASQKNYISLYVCALEDGEYVAEKYAKQLGKVSVGKSCIRFKKLEDLNLKTLGRIIKKAAKNPGLISAAMKK